VLAYVFWHRPDRSVDPADYERRLAGFHERMAADPPGGFAGSAAFRVGALPWLPDGGYEDWYLVRGWADLGVLNDAAVDPGHVVDHNAVARHAADGAAGVYALRAGDLPLRFAGAAEWTDKPRGLSYAGFEQDLIGDRDEREMALWQRRLVLSPAPEFCLLTPGSARVRVTA
jgi:hypothetical protein